MLMINNTNLISCRMNERASTCTLETRATMCWASAVHRLPVPMLTIAHLTTNMIKQICCAIGMYRHCKGVVDDECVCVCVECGPTIFI